MPKFQQRHYQALAKVMQEAYRFADTPTHAAVERIEDLMVSMLTVDNPLFDPERFREACVPGANVRAGKRRRAA